MTAVGRIELADCPMPAAGADEVVVRMEYCGICGSDAHFYKEGRIGKKVAPLPFILGHEVSGYVTECGADVTPLPHAPPPPSFRFYSPLPPIHPSFFFF